MNFVRIQEFSSAEFAEKHHLFALLKRIIIPIVSKILNVTNSLIGRLNVEVKI